MKPIEGQAEARRRRGLRTRAITFAIACLAAVLILAALGASPVLILETFGLAVILGLSALAIILVLRGMSGPRR